AAAAYSFNLQTTPAQCQNLTVSITGSGGTPPYKVLILPFGGSPLPNNIEARKIVEQPFPGSATSVSFQLNYPTNSQFVTVVSDASGFGTGGTSAAATVQSSSDSSCFDATTNVSPAFAFNIEPPNQIVQCNASRLWWDPARVQGNPSFFGVIPGGQSFQIQQGDLTNVANEGTGFQWTPSVRTGTTVMLGAGDNRGFGSGGSVTLIVQAGSFPNGDCLSNSSPSSTAGSPAGGSYPTGTGSSSPSVRILGQSLVGPCYNYSPQLLMHALLGGVLGGVVAIAALLLFLLFLRRRRRLHQTELGKERPDLFNEGPATSAGGVPPNAQAHPFVLPEISTTHDPSEAGGTENAGLAGAASASGRYSTGTSDHRYSVSTDGRPLTPSAYGATSTSGTSRKSPMPPMMRPVNVVQHDDGGGVPMSPPPDEDAETVELPPAYTNIK
ncbi:hypothetical protein BD410DRAFT_698316, partial [Rickenella mellea]